MIQFSNHLLLVLIHVQEEIGHCIIDIQVFLFSYHYLGNWWNYICIILNKDINIAYFTLCCAIKFNIFSRGSILISLTIAYTCDEKKPHFWSNIGCRQDSYLLGETPKVMLTMETEANDLENGSFKLFEHKA